MSLDAFSIFWLSASIDYYNYHIIIIEVVLFTADWWHTEERELCKHFTYITFFIIHNSPMGIKTIIPYLIGQKLSLRDW